MKPSIVNSLIFVWYHPDDHEIAFEIAGNLKDQGVDIQFNPIGLQSGEFSFNSIEWWLSQSPIVIFLLSESALSAPILQDDIKKVLRADRKMLVPVILDDYAARNLPLLLKFSPKIDCRHPDYQKGSKLTREIQSKVSRYGENSIPSGFLLKRLFRWIIEHFRTYLIQRPLTFCWRITVENLIVSLTVTGLIQFLYQPPTRTNLDEINAVSFLWLVVILGPIVETIFLQGFPVFVARKVGFKYSGQILFSVIPFALLHFSRSIGTGIGAGVIGGFYSAFTYVHWRDDSLWTAFWVTALSHGLYNFALFAMLIGEF